MLLYYITDRSRFSGNEPSRCSQLLKTISQAARCGVDYIQIREKDLSIHDLENLARSAIQLRTENPKLKTAFLVNSRTDIAMACGAQGVHLPSNDISPSEVRRIWAERSSAQIIIGASCHSRVEVAHAAQEGADFAVFGPVFEKARTLATGLDALREACREEIPVLALGGVTLANAETCIQAGAAGIAAIRLFQENEMEGVVTALRRIRADFGPQTSGLSQSKG